ncbi:MAG: hypothetical protein KF868_21125 [Acidobacteria bacterium]|nr:hypothetical protein [Acidobacteriota bacterium]MCW5970282.1 hypothetical protein [Blastocatellales bacterium]
MRIVRRLQYVVAKLQCEKIRLHDADLERLDFLSKELSLIAPYLAEPLASEFSKILAGIRVGGTYKTTGRGRLQATERVICDYYADRLRHPLNFLDLGGSDGTTTLDAVRVFRRKLCVDVKACLLDLHPWLLRYCRGPVTEYRSRFEEPILVRIGKWGLRLNDGSDDALAQKYLQMAWFRRWLKRGGEVKLVNPLVQRDSSITVHAGNCFYREPAFEGRFDVVRVSNLLNLSYFPKPEIRTAIGHLHNYLVEDGLLVISRNDQREETEVECGSLWEKSGERFRHLEDFGGGSEIKSLVEKYPA